MTSSAAPSPSATALGVRDAATPGALGPYTVARSDSAGLGLPAPARPSRSDPALDQLQQHVRDLNVLKDFADTMLTHRGGIDEVLWAVAQQAVARMGLEDCVIYLLDEASQDLVQCAAFGPKNPRGREILNPIRIPVGRGIVGSVAATGQVEMIADTACDPRYIQDDRRRLSELAVPIQSDGRVIGVIDSEHSARGFFTRWHRDLFVALAAMAAGRVTAALLEAHRRRLTTRDALTDLANRNELLNQLQLRLGQADCRIAVLFLDLDHFSVFNDTLGHVAGDELLRLVARRVAAVAPPDAVLARLGSDEFVVVIDGDLDSGRALAARLVDEVSRPLDSGALAGLRVGCSAGVAAAVAGAAADAVLNEADLARHEAKRAGRNRVSLHDAGLAAARRQQQRLVVELTRALDGTDPPVSAHFQPIYTATDRRLIAVEALARWQHPELGLVAPLDFIAAAERTGKIHALGRHIMQLALRSRRTWHDLAPDLVINVNVSALQLQHDGFAAQLLELLAETGVAPAQVACEVTESGLIGENRSAALAVRALARAGVRLVLDDFGTGFASLAALTQHPFSGVKIDGSFVRDLAANPSARAIVQSVISLARDLGLSCTAEGIEQPADFAMLRDMGCPCAQGFWLCEPLPAERLRQLLASS